MIQIPNLPHGSSCEIVGKTEYIYADNASTTIIRPLALTTYVKTCASAYGNPSSHHLAGRIAHDTLEWARTLHAKFMNVTPDTIYFTSSGTESNNIAIRGVLMNARSGSGRSMVLTSSVEHSSVRKTAELAAGANNHIMVPVDSMGHVNEDAFRDLLQTNANQIALVSIILAQNEVGTFQRIPLLSKMAKTIVGPQVVFHTDATQAFGKYFIDPESLGVDLLTASSHKYHGPRGVGILYAKTGVLDPSMLPITGGGQERGCRSGTENVPAIAAAATAFNYMLENQERWIRRKTEVRAMRDRIVKGISDRIPGVVLNGDLVCGLYNMASIVLPNVSGAEVARLADLAGIAIGSGSACNKGRPSESMLSMGKTPQEVLGTVRISLSEFNTMRECDEIVKTIVTAWNDIANGK
jgi:cysteine desulfurase